jgi:osmotically-inducible protein OsmY
MKTVRLGILLGLLALLAPAAGGAQEPSPPPAPQTQTAPAAPATPSPLGLQERPPVPAHSDEEIRAAVEEALSRDVSIAQHARLRVGCEEGILTLSGEAETLEILNQARRLAGDTRGVLDVVVLAGISTRGAPDPQILMEIQQALDIPTFRGDSISVGVHGGQVNLTGTATTYARKLLADAAASAVPGVVEIINSLRVVAPREGDDNELEQRIRRLLTGGLTPVPGVFIVAVQGDHATLKGKVPLFSHRIQAERLALSVGGISSVDNRLKVDPSLLPPGHPQPSQP